MGFKNMQYTWFTLRNTVSNPRLLDDLNRAMKDLTPETGCTVVVVTIHNVKGKNAVIYLCKNCGKICLEKSSSIFLKEHGWTCPDTIPVQLNITLKQASILEQILSHVKGNIDIQEDLLDVRQQLNNGNVFGLNSCSYCTGSIWFFNNQQDYIDFERLKPNA